MKKMVIAMAALLMLASCGGAGETPATDSLVAPVDSLEITVDSANVVTNAAQLDDAASTSESAAKIPTDNKDNESLEEIKLP